MLADTVVAVDRDGLLADVVGARAGLGWNVVEGRRALCWS